MTYMRLVELYICIYSGSHPQARRAPFVEDAAPFRQGEKPLCKLLQEPNISSIYIKFSMTLLVWRTYIRVHHRSDTRCAGPARVDKSMWFRTFGPGPTDQPILHM